MGKKVRAAQLAKAPYVLVIGDKEIESGELTVEIAKASRPGRAVRRLRRGAGRRGRLEAPDPVAVRRLTRGRRGPRVERIWSPWRMAYIQAAKEQGEDGGCIFCDLPAEGDDVRTMILARGELAFVIVNSFPYNPGHLMVAPFRHVGAFTSLEAAELADVDALVARSIRALEQEMEPHGYNLGMNLGPRRRRRHPRSRALAPRPSLERRHELHAGRRADPRAAGAARGNVRAAPAALRGCMSEGRGFADRGGTPPASSRSNASSPGARSLAFIEVDDGDAHGERPRRDRRREARMGIGGEGPDVVFLHPGLWDSRVWDQQVGVFSKTYHVVRYDLRGYGRSSRPGREALLARRRPCRRPGCGRCRRCGDRWELDGRTGRDRFRARSIPNASTRWSWRPRARRVRGPEEVEGVRRSRPGDRGGGPRRRLRAGEELSSRWLWARLGTEDPAGARIRRIAFDNLHETTMDESGAARLDDAFGRLGESTYPRTRLPADHDPPVAERMAARSRRRPERSAGRDPRHRPRHLRAQTRRVQPRRPGVPRRGALKPVQTFLVLGAIFGFIGVALGAFGSHALRSKLTSERVATSGPVFGIRCGTRSRCCRGDRRSVDTERRVAVVHPRGRPGRSAVPVRGGVVVRWGSSCSRAVCTRSR